MEEEIPHYELDSDTQALMTTVLELALMSANLQLDPKNTQAVMDIVFQTAYRFGIEFSLREPEVAAAKETGIPLDDLPFDIQVTFIDKSK